MKHLGRLRIISGLSRPPRQRIRASLTSADTAAKRVGTVRQTDSAVHTGNRLSGTNNGASKSRFDFVVFGATGVTGQYVVEELSNVIIKQGSKVTMAIAGRNEEKLKDVLKRVSAYTGRNISQIPVLMADTDDKASLKAMCSNTKVLLNCVGPYNIHGQQVITACIEEGTHQLDVSGETLFLEKIQLLYHKEARQKGVYVVGSCGSPGIFNDLAIEFIRKTFRGCLTSITSYLKVTSVSQDLIFNATTFISAIDGFAKDNELREQRKRLFQGRPQQRHRQSARKAGYHPEICSWCVVWPGCDQSIVNRNINHKDQIPAYFYFSLNNFKYMVLTICLGYLNKYLSKSKLLRTFISKHPGVFTNGKFRKGGPTRKQVEESSFLLTLVARGQSGNEINAENSQSASANEHLIMRISGPEVAYAASAICIVQCGMTLLEEIDKLPEKTALLKRLAENSIDIKIDDKDIAANRD